MRLRHAEHRRRRGVVGEREVEAARHRCVQVVGHAIGERVTRLVRRLELRGRIAAGEHAGVAAEPQVPRQAGLAGPRQGIFVRPLPAGRLRQRKHDVVELVDDEPGHELGSLQRKRLRAPERHLDVHGGRRVAPGVDVGPLVPQADADRTGGAGRGNQLVLVARFLGVYGGFPDGRARQPGRLRKGIDRLVERQRQREHVAAVVRGRRRDGHRRPPDVHHAGELGRVARVRLRPDDQVERDGDGHLRLQVLRRRVGGGGVDAVGGQGQRADRPHLAAADRVPRARRAGERDGRVVDPIDRLAERKAQGGRGVRQVEVVVVPAGLQGRGEGRPHRRRHPEQGELARISGVVEFQVCARGVARGRQLVQREGVVRRLGANRPDRVRQLKNVAPTGAHPEHKPLGCASLIAVGGVIRAADRRGVRTDDDPAGVIAVTPGRHIDLEVRAGKAVSRLAADIDPAGPHVGELRLGRQDGVGLGGRQEGRQEGRGGGQQEDGCGSEAARAEGPGWARYITAVMAGRRPPRPGSAHRAGPATTKSAARRLGGSAARRLGGA